MNNRVESLEHHLSKLGDGCSLIEVERNRDGILIKVRLLEHKADGYTVTIDYRSDEASELSEQLEVLRERIEAARPLAEGLALEVRVEAERTKLPTGRTFDVLFAGRLADCSLLADGPSKT